MIILHAATPGNRFFVWGEVPAEHAARAKRRGRRAPTVRQVLPLPYAGDVEALYKGLSDAGLTQTSNYPSAECLVAWLPTINRQPLPSSPLIAELPEAREKAKLSPWIVVAQALPPTGVIELLCACIGMEVLAPGVIIGRDLAYWANALRLAGHIVARQSFLPGINMSGRDTRAEWQPIYSGPDAQRFSILAAAMPHACRALTKLDADRPPDSPATLVLGGFVTRVVDRLVRTASLPIDQHTAARLSRKWKQEFDSVHDQWLDALRATDGVMKGDASEMARFAEQVHEWQRPAIVPAATPFRLSFRLEEPEEQEGIQLPRGGMLQQPASVNGNAWRVRYLLQANDDPSLLLPASEVWTAGGRQPALMKSDKFKPREYLLSALGQAAKISPQIERSLKAAKPDGYELDAAGAHEFLQAQSWMLEEAGFGVMLPAWWTRKGTKLKLAARAVVDSPKFQAKAGLSLDRLVDFNWEIALGDEQLTPEELRMLARLKSPLVKFRGRWTQVNAEEIQAALAYWENGTKGKASARDVIRMALGVQSEGPGGIAFAGVKAKGWLGDLLAQLEGGQSLEELPAPEKFTGKLRPYQVRGYSWLCFLKRWGFGACLADDMGLGKTPQTLALIQSDWLNNGRRPTLVVCPTSVVGNWQKEAARFTPDLPVMVHHGLTRAKGAAFKKSAEKHALVLSSYSLLYRDFEFLKQVNWSGVVLDEAQNIKNSQTKQAQAARTLPANYRVALTGTPVENNIGDLWSIMEFLNPGTLGTLTQFKREFFVPIQANNDAEATERLKRLTGPFILRRLKTDKKIISDLPKKLEMKVFCTLTKEQASLYEAVVNEVSGDLDQAEGIQRKGIVLATLTRLKQVCNHPAHFLGDNSAIPGRSGKLARLTEMLEEVASIGERALVFTQFAEMGHIIQRHLQETFGHEVLFLHGAVPKKHRDRMIERFQNDKGGPRVFLLSLKAGGTGLNLTAANHVFHFDRWWNPAVENQATDRAFRIGQKRNVQVHKFLCVGTLEERIDEMIERKQELASRIVGTGEGWITELSTDALKDLFALRKSAVAE